MIALVAVRVARADKGEGLKQGALLGAVMGVGLSTKLTTIFAIPVVVVLVWGHRSSWRERLRFAGAFLVLCLALGSWWYLRNLYLYRDPFPNFAGGMGTEEQLRTTLLLDPFGQGLRIVGNALSVVACSSLVPEFAWTFGGFVSHALVKATVGGLAGAVVMIYLVFALLRRKQGDVQVTQSLWLPGLLGGVLAVLMVLQFALFEDYRGISSGGRYVVQSVAWLMLVVLGAGERLGALVPSRPQRTVLTALMLVASVTGGVVWLHMLGRWYAIIQG